MTRLVVVVGVVTWLGCGQAGKSVPLVLPAPESAVPARPSFDGEFKAGFARVDITPPPGMGLSGNGFEGQQARGWRHRLYARAMILEDRFGERIAFLVVDLPHISSLLHRLTAEQTARGVARVGADRLILSATHTHSSVGNHYSAHGYNQMSGPYEGFDSLWVEFVVQRMARSVQEAAQDLGPARAVWSWGRVDSVVQNRSPEPFKANPQTWGGFADDTLYMLRVDQCRTPGCVGTNALRRRGAFGIFGIHGTGYPTTGDLMDGDIHAVVQRMVERAVDKANGVPDWRDRFRPEGVFVMANGTEGDITPLHSPGTRCERWLRQLPAARPAGPRGAPAPPEEWKVANGVLERCHERARESVSRIAGRLGDSAVARLDRTAPISGMRIQRAFTTVHLPTTTSSPPICPSPRFGTANVGGAPTDTRTRLYKWSLFWFIKTGFEQGERSVADPPHWCQGEKRVGLGFFLQGLVAGDHAMPEYAQFSVVRVGRVLIASVPWEVTTVASRWIKRALLAKAPSGVEQVVVIGLANGYFQYLTTPDEYALQYYEGGSVQYGRNTLYLVVDVLERLTASLDGGRPIVNVGPITAYPGAYKTYFRQPDTGPEPHRITRTIESLVCSETTVVADWVDVAPGRLQPSEGPVVKIFDHGKLVAWDDHPAVEVRALRSLGNRGYRWRVTYRVPTPPNGQYMVRIVARAGFAEAVERACP